MQGSIISDEQMREFLDGGGSVTNQGTGDAKGAWRYSPHYGQDPVMEPYEELQNWIAPIRPKKGKK